MVLSANPKISVIVPIFGVERFIERCAISLFEQTFQDIEYIFVNDCTKDASINILLDVIERYPDRKNNISIINHEVNQGLPTARKTGILAAKGDYIIHCDSDDWISKDLYEKMYESISSSNADVAICNIKCTDGNAITCVKKGTSTLDYNSFLSNVIRMKSSWSLVNKMFKRSVYSEEITYPTSYMGEDMALCLQLLSACHNITYIDDSYYFYLINLQTESKSEEKDTIIRLYTMFAQNFMIVLKHFKEAGLYNKYSDDLSYSLFLNSLIFSKRAKSICFLKKKKYYVPSTPLKLSFDTSIPFTLRIEALLFYLLNI